jgi:hypothetical protein
VQSRAALAVAQGVSMALGDRDVPASALDGVAESDAHAAEMAFRINVERHSAKMRALARGGLAAVLGASR